MRIHRFTPVILGNIDAWRCSPPHLTATFASSFELGTRANYLVRSAKNVVCIFFLMCLKEGLYHDAAAMAGSATNQTAYKWSFASKASSADVNALRAAREEVDSATYRASGNNNGHDRGTSGRVIGPALPSASDLVLAREAQSEQQASERDFKRKRDRTEAKERLEDVVGPKEVGREGMLEKKRARRENDRAFRERGEDGYEANESTLLGCGDSFKDQYVSSFSPGWLPIPMTALHDGTLLVNVSKKSVRSHEKTRGRQYVNVQLLCVTRTRRPWTCFSNLPNNDLDSFISIVHIFVSTLPCGYYTLVICCHLQVLFLCYAVLRHRTN